MALFMLDCDSVTSTGSTLDSVAKELSNIESSVNGYDTSCEDGFDFASAKTAIANNIEACSIKVQNASKIISAVVSSHTDLQNKLIYGKKEESTQQQRQTSTGGNTSGGGGGGGYYSGGGGGGGSYSGGGGGYTGAAAVTGTTSALSAISEELTADEIAKLREILEGASSVEIKTEVKKITCTPVDKEKLTDEEKAIFENEKFTYNTDGYAMLGNRYVISCDKSFGKVGDAITFIRKDGTSVDCIIGHVTEDEASKNTVNFYVDPEKWKASNENNITIDLAKDISKVTNSGKVSLKSDAKTDTKTDTKTDSTTDTNTDTGTNSTGTESTNTETNSTTTDVKDDNPNVGMGTDETKAVNPLKATVDRAKENSNTNTTDTSTSTNTETTTTDTTSTSTDTTSTTSTTTNSTEESTSVGTSILNSIFSKDDDDEDKGVNV